MITSQPFRISPIPAFFLVLLIPMGSLLAQEASGSGGGEYHFERYFSVLAILYGLALAKLVGELGRIVRYPRNIPRSVAQIIWILAILLGIVIMFFAGATNETRLNEFPSYIVAIVLAILLYLTADALVLSDTEKITEERNFRTEFRSRSRLFVSCAILTLLWLTLREVAVFGISEENTKEITLNLGMSVVLSILLVVPRLHPGVALLSLIALIYHIVTEWIEAA